MRTFPKALATLRKIVCERGERLRKLAFADLQQLTDEPVEHITVESRATKIATIVQMVPNDGLRVVIQGFMKARFIPGEHVALDGFYKYADGTMSAMPNEEFYEFG